ncbi:MAG: sodium-dependent bicarbonate transport family permease [Sphingomonadaceae bacterium]|uniref:sodium-dependent bicarbonate transport family permease n=1 Tax=Thermaurantiacus sp. TaxID=2820283 RepID=UPI00298EF8DE|nr:sodium-dependent bicarbonate transport family permease [Thermaurantiacus sp.]MCS6986026.1 sodium-dependent bicarbonate transport family permease [Sphingomonadaceae bacterium]MDW8414758.1 sodium-dependent bicarbonate transport family permease [Thermaurantiacus sp.]
MPTATLIENLVSPITLAFLLGVVASLLRSDLEIPEPVIRIISIYLLFSIGLQGGRELADVTWAEIAAGLSVVSLLIFLLPAGAFLVARRALKLSVPDATGVAALYGSVSSVTFLVGRTYADGMGTPMDGFVIGLVALMELAILVALFIGRWASARAAAADANLGAMLLETVRGRGLLLLGGGLLMGAAIGPANFERISPFFVDLFRGVLVLFILEMGMAAARQLKSFGAVAGRMAVFGIVVPVVHGLVATGFATAAGLSLGSAAVLGTVAASASYIDAPAAVRATFPDANPAIWLTASLGITFPFMMLAGVPLVYQFARMWAGL